MPNWGQVLSEIQQLSGTLAAGTKKAPDTIRGKYLSALHTKRQRNVIAYYSGFLSKPDAALLESTMKIRTVS